MRASFDSRSLASLLITLFANASNATSQAATNELPDPAFQASEVAAELLRQGRFEQAVAGYQQVLEERRAEHGNQHELVARAHHNLSFALSQSGRGEAAVEAAATALSILQKVASEDPSMVIIARRHLAEIAERAGQFEFAWREIETVCAEAEERFGKTPLVGEAHEIAGRLAHRCQDRGTAQHHYQWAAAIYEKFYGMNNPTRTVRPMVGLAVVLGERGQWVKARQVTDHARAWLNAAQLQGTPQWVDVLKLGVRCLDQLDEHEPAIALLGELVSSANKAPISQSLARDVVFQSLQLGAPQLARNALETLRSAGPRDEPLPPWIAMADAEIDRLQGRPQEALHKSSLLLESTHSNGVHENCDAVHLLHGRALLACGDAEDATRELVALLRRQREMWGEDHPFLVETFLSLVSAEFQAHGTSVELIDALAMLESSMASMSPPKRARLLRGDQRSPTDRWFDAVKVAHCQLAENRANHARPALLTLERLRQAELRIADALFLEARPQEGSLGELLEQFQRDEAGHSRKEDRSQQKQRIASRLDAWLPTGAPQRSLFEMAGVDEADLETLLQGNARLVSFCWTDQQLWAFLAGNREDSDRVARIGSSSTIAALIDEIRTQGKVGSEPSSLAALGNALFAPLLDDLHGAERIHLAADGPLNTLPLDRLLAEQLLDQGARTVVSQAEGIVQLTQSRNSSHSAGSTTAP